MKTWKEIFLSVLMVAVFAAPGYAMISYNGSYGHHSVTSYARINGSTIVPVDEHRWRGGREFGEHRELREHHDWDRGYYGHDYDEPEFGIGINPYPYGYYYDPYYDPYYYSTPGFGLYFGF